MSLGPLTLLALVAGSNLLCLLVLVFLRNRARTEANRLLAFREIWKPLLMMRSLGQVQPLPPLLPEQRVWLLHLWNEQQQQVRGEASDRLNGLIDALELRPALLEMLTSKSQPERLVAAHALGQLRETQAWDPLVRLALEADSLLAFMALRSLLLISAEAALPVLLDTLRARRDWSRARLLGVLRRMPSPRLVEPLGEALNQAIEEGDPELAVDLIQLLGVMRYPQAMAYLRRALASKGSAAVLAAALELLGEMRDPESMPRFEVLTRHPDPDVRQQAVRALGHLAGPDQIPTLLAMLEDSYWWTVYRSIEALHRIPGIRPEKLAELYRHPSSLVREVMAYYQTQANLNESPA